ncbi:MFNG acetylglucosaminyltransferase, partial [Alaudala cheleensis]|nr:MFNG acetylglucosaminyltransferase [Alaudala cheleensis]
MGCRLIHGASGAAVFFVSVALLSMWHRGAREAAQYPGIREGMLEKPEQQSLTLGDTFIAVKTTKRFHQSRMELLLDTWISQASKQTYIFTDEDDALKRRMGGHVIFTNCSADHSHQALQSTLLTANFLCLPVCPSWFCHLDDDNYLNPWALLKLLSYYVEMWDVFLGKLSLNRPIWASKTLPNNQMKSVCFWFVTGGAGFCISRELAKKLVPWASGRNFLSTSKLICLPDDCTVDYIIKCKVGGQLIPNTLFHSHLENLWLIPTSQLTQQVRRRKEARGTYGVFEYKLNVIELSGPFSSQEDPSRHGS